MSDIKLIRSVPSIPPRPVDGHKGLFGRVLVVGGRPGMIGAPAFAAGAALRSGAGLVEVAVPAAILNAVQGIYPESIGIGLADGGGEQKLLAAAKKADAIIVGPGLGDSPRAWARVKALIQLDSPMVVDADALNLLARQRRWPKTFRARAVLTPHPGEMRRLMRLLDDPGTEEVPTDDAGRCDLAARAARKFGQIIVLKGHRTVITDGRRAHVNQTGDSTLSKAGAGDVLCGIIACLLAQRMNPFDAAVLGVNLHGRAGEIAGETFTQRSALARDVVDCIADVFMDVE